MESARLTAFQDFHMKFLFAHCAITRNFFLARWHRIHVWQSKLSDKKTTNNQCGPNESKADLSKLGDFETCEPKMHALKLIHFESSLFFR